MLQRALRLLYKTLDPISPVTMQPFSPGVQKRLIQIAKQRRYKSRYWVSAPQARRTFDTLIKSHATPAVVSFDITSVVRLDQLEHKDAQRVMDTNPPYFTSGIGVLAGPKKKWMMMSTKKLTLALNPRREERVLWIDKEYVVQENLRLRPNAVYKSIEHLSQFKLFNGDQAENPDRITPLRGLALNGCSGKRFPQPTHDLLVSISIARGYTTPLWVPVRLLDLVFHTEIKEELIDHRVVVPTMIGSLLPLNTLPRGVRRGIRKVLGANPPRGETNDKFLLSAGGWEKVMHKGLRDAMAASKNLDRVNLKHWVNIDDLSGIMSSEEICASILEQENWQEITQHAIDSSAVTCIDVVNASCTKHPLNCFPRARRFAIVKGRLLGYEAEMQLWNWQNNKKFASPIWLTSRDAHRLGVGILEGAEGVLLQNKSYRTESHVYNIDDLREPDVVLRNNPPKTRALHQILSLQWRPVTSKEKAAILQSHNRKRNLWLTVSEVVMSGFALVPGACAVDLDKNSADENGSVDEREILFNSEQTTDPVRVLALSTYFVRPQGVFM